MKRASQRDWSPRCARERDWSPRCARERDWSPRVPRKRDWSPLSTRKRDWSPLSSRKRHWSPCGARERDWSPRGSCNRDWSPCGARERDWSPRGSCKRDCSPLNIRELDWTPRGTNEWDWSPHRTSKRVWSPRSTREHDWSPHSARGRDWSPRSTHKRDWSPRNTHERDWSPYSYRDRDWSPRSTHKWDWSPRRTRERDWSPHSTRKQDWSPRSTCEQDWSPRSTCERDWSPRSTREREWSPQSASSAKRPRECESSSGRNSRRDPYLSSGASSLSLRALTAVKAKVPQLSLQLCGQPPAVTAPLLLLAPSLRLSAGLGLAGEPPGSSEYKTLLVSGLGTALPDKLLEDGLFHQFQRFVTGGASDISIKLSHTQELGRIAYVNFTHPADAWNAHQHAGAQPLLLCDRPLKVEPVYLQGEQRSHSHPPTPAPKPPAFLPPIRGVYPDKQTSLPPIANPFLREPRPPHTQAPVAAFALEAVALGLSPVQGRVLDEHIHPYDYPTVAEEDLTPEDYQRGTRTLFIGNLDHQISEGELRRAFEKYGIIEEAVIKRPAKGQGGIHAFVKFQNLDMAYRAKVAMSGQVVGTNPIKIGYGKASPTNRLWVGGLGPSTFLPALAEEFGRFGRIRAIDYVQGDSFAYIQYESLDAAHAACAQMRGYPLGGPGRRLRVDFANVEEAHYPQRY